MYITKETTGSWTLRDRVRMPDGTFHDMKVRGYAKKSDAKDDYENQVQLFIDRWEKKENVNKLRSMKGNTLWEITEEYMYNHSLKVKESSMLKTKNDVKKLIDFFGGDKVADEVFTESNMMLWKKYVLQMPINGDGKNNLLNLTKAIIDRTVRRGKVVNTEEANRSTLALETIRVERKPKEEENVWSMDEYEAFLDTFDTNDIFYFVFLTFGNTGCRCGELSGLQWKHLDFFNKTMTIEQQANNQLRQGHAVITSPKTFSGYRTIDLCDFYISEMKRYKDMINPSQDDFIFVGKRGDTLAPTTIRRELNKHIDLADVRQISTHGLRHTYATMLYHQGSSIKYMQEKLGHSSYEETMKTYTHLLQEDKANMMEKVDKIFMRH